VFSLPRVSFRRSGGETAVRSLPEREIPVPAAAGIRGGSSGVPGAKLPAERPLGSLPTFGQGESTGESAQYALSLGHSTRGPRCPGESPRDSLSLRGRARTPKGRPARFKTLLTDSAASLFAL
jgi:hypothetical protein